MVETFYSALQGGTCYLFEEDIAEVPPGVGEVRLDYGPQRQRDITPQDERELQKQLDLVLEGVTVPKRP